MAPTQEKMIWYSAAISVGIGMKPKCKSTLLPWNIATAHTAAATLPPAIAGIELVGRVTRALTSAIVVSVT